MDDEQRLQQLLSTVSTAGVALDEVRKLLADRGLDNQALLVEHVRRSLASLPIPSTDEQVDALLNRVRTALVALDEIDTAAREAGLVGAAEVVLAERRALARAADRFLTDTQPIG